MNESINSGINLSYFQGELWKSVLENIISSIILAIILATFGYLFRNKIKTMLAGNDLLPKDKTPTVEIGIWDGDVRDKDNKPITFISLTNVGSVGVTMVRLFYYEVLENENVEKMTLKLLKPTNQGYKYVGSDCGESMGLRFNYLQDIILTTDAVNTSFCDRGFFIEMIDERGIIYRKKVYAGVDKQGNIDISPQSTMRARKRLPNRTICMRLKHLVKRYDIDISVG